MKPGAGTCVRKGADRSWQWERPRRAVIPGSGRPIRAALAPVVLASILLVPEDAPEERRRSRLAYERLWGTGTAVDVLVWTASAFESRLHLRASLPATVEREGRILDAA